MGSDLVVFTCNSREILSFSSRCVLHLFSSTVLMGFDLVGTCACDTSYSSPKPVNQVGIQVVGIINAGHVHMIGEFTSFQIGTSILRIPLLAPSIFYVCNLIASFGSQGF